MPRQRWEPYSCRWLATVLSTLSPGSADINYEILREACLVTLNAKMLRIMWLRVCLMVICVCLKKQQIANGIYTEFKYNSNQIEDATNFLPYFIDVDKITGFRFSSHPKHLCIERFAKPSSIYKVLWRLMSREPNSGSQGSSVLSAFLSTKSIPSQPARVILLKT